MQLYLFDKLFPDQPAPAAAPDQPGRLGPLACETPSPKPSVPIAPVPQLDLFEDGSMHLQAARSALAEGRFADAARLFNLLAASYPDHAALAQDAAGVSVLHGRLQAIDALPSHDRPAAWLALAQGIRCDTEIWQSARKALFLRIAESLRRERGDAAELDDQPPGFYFLEAGALTDAVASLQNALSVERRARYGFLLGDAMTRLGDTHAARIAYLNALFLDPFDPAFGTAADGDVRELHAVARYEFEIEEEPVAWAAAVGIVTGVLPRPAALANDAFVPRQGPGGAARTPAQAAALGQAREFVIALVAAASQSRTGDAERVIEARRTMKRAAPALFEAYLERVVKARKG